MVRSEGELPATEQGQEHPPASAWVGDYGSALASGAEYTRVSSAQLGLAKIALIETRVPNAARVADYLYGGRDNFEADRKAARALTAATPGIADIAPAARAFQQRVLRFLVVEAGIRQFLDIGSGWPWRAIPTRSRSLWCPSAGSRT
jgi:hypothetical protein